MTLDLFAKNWRSIPGHPHYEVSDCGRVRSLDRVQMYSFRGRLVARKHRGKILQAGTMERGHQFVVLGRKKGFCVHVLVLLAFVGPPQPGQECCHYDDNPANNRLSNLRWGTRSENIADFRRNHGYHQGTRNADRRAA